MNNLTPAPSHPYKLLGGTQLQRTKDTLRLSETKLANIEDSLRRVQQQQEWLRRFNELKIELQQEKERLFMLSKQQAGLSEERIQLERYETFESIQGTFQRLTLLERQVAQNKRDMSLLEHDSEQTLHLYEEQLKKQQALRDVRQQAEQHLYNIHDQLFLSEHLAGHSEKAQEEIHFLQNTVSNRQQQLKALEGLLAEKAEEVDDLVSELERLRAGRQSMEMHEPMLQHGDSVLLVLDNLQEVETQQQSIKQLQKDTAKRRDEKNEQLSRVFSQYQDILSQIDALEDELRTHRRSIQGQDSYKVQERAMKLKSRIQMLQSAQSLWKRISTGYLMIEEKTQLLNSLRLHIEQAQQNVRTMESDFGRTARLCHEKEYTYLLSKGQNIIQLRAELKEGVNCSVCGATHHPYHSDTMLDQSKLIGEFKTDYELLAQEMRSKQQQLDELKLDLSETKGRHMAEENALASLRQRQAEDVNEWRIYASLDRQFEECSASTNLDARTAILRQLIENTTRDAELAQKELDTFNFHQSNITQLSEKLQQLEQRKNELSTRLNELNTACQVMAGQVEGLQNLADTVNTRYSQIYKMAGELITIRDWLAQWRLSHESLRGQIQKLMTAWETVNDRILKGEKELAEEKTILLSMQQKHKDDTATIEAILTRIEASQTVINENTKNSERAIGQTDAKTLFQELFSKYQLSHQAMEREMDTTDRIRRQRDRIKGRNDFYLQSTEQLSQQMIDERSRLDLWIRQFNAQNPPVVYQELEQVFANSKDWNETRRRVHKMTLDTAICQSRVDNLNSRFIALQAEGGHITQSEEELQLSLSTQQEHLTSQRRDVMLQIARMTVALEEHEKALHAANNALSTAEDSL